MLESLGSTTLHQSPTILKAFDGRGFHPYGILPDLPIGVEGKTINLDVKVVDAPLDYNLLLDSTTLFETVHTDEKIREILFVDDLPWEDLHHQSSFLPELDHFENDFSSIFTADYVKEPQNPLKHSDSELNLGNISRTIPIDISVKPRVIENIHIGASCMDKEIQTYKALFQEFRDVFAWSYKEMPGINPSIVVHEIKTYPDAKPVWQRLRQIHTRKAAAIKAEVEKLLKAGFIYPIPLTDWVSNIVPINKKQGTIQICIYYRDINRAYPKDNYPTPYTDQIIDDCAGSEMFSFMDGFSGYNQINILPTDQPKMAFICPWGTFANCKLPFGLKNAGATFQKTMS
eukprot:PITA_24659